MKILLTGGGTGGHFYPALTVAKKARQRGWQVLLVGANRGIEKNYKEEDIPILTLPSSPKATHPGNFLSFAKAVKIIKSFKPNAVIGFGGYASLPVVTAAVLKKIPLFLHEQNAIAGRVNRFFLKFCRQMFASFPLRNVSSKKIKLVGNPVRDEVLKWIGKKKEALLHLNLEDKPTLLVFGGSGGARFINQTFAEIIDKLPEWLQVIWITGKRDYNDFADFVRHKSLKSKLLLLAYLEEMGAAYAASDVVISRAGASTIFELIFFKKPAFLIPFPYAVGNHQFYNALYLVYHKVAKMKLQEDVEPENMLRLIFQLFENKDDMARHFSLLPHFDPPNKILNEVERSLT